MAFELHERLEADTAFVADWGVSRVLLMNDARYPWLILVPRREGITELFQLTDHDRAMLMEEIARASETLKIVTEALKINVGALGNLVPQLHIHVVARNEGDEAWPGPVWGNGIGVPYDAEDRTEFVSELREEFAD